ncbi:MAG: LytTR family DNA-binding domain-containing protein [Bacteroidota bacterium]|nr:LytTR family DNA-binding domain-containing protein [Bacteroidota bacterium]
MEKQIKAIIVEDESLAAELLRSYLQSFPQIHIDGEYSDGFSGIMAINSKKPDLIFLDIRLPKISGVELVELIDHKPEIIFTTAYDKFAIKAFEMNAVDYLLKPFSRDRFNTAVQRALERIDGGESQIPAELMTKAYESMEQVDRVVVKDKNKIHVIPAEDIYYLEAQDDYVMIHTENKRFLKQKTLKSFENTLEARVFIRVHRSYIVQIDKISRLELFEKESYHLILGNGEVVPTSKPGYKALKTALKF